MVTLRSVRPFDWPDIEAMLAATSSPDEFDTGRPSCCVVAEEAGNFVGFAMVERFDDVGLLSAVHVELDCQGHGLGSALVYRAVSEAFGAGLSWIFVCAGRLQTFFERAGFEAEDAALLPNVLESRLRLIEVASCNLMSLENNRAAAAQAG